MTRSRTKRVEGYWPSHTPFHQLIEYSVRGTTTSHFTTGRATDHIAELCMLMHGDVDHALWRKGAPKDGIAARKIVDALADQVRTTNDIEAAETLFSVATYAVFEVLNLYLRDRDSFDRIAPRRTLLPCFVSIHPNTKKVTAEMSRDARLGTATPESAFIGSRPWFISDAAPSLYARAIITSIELNRNLEPIDVQQRSWLPFDRENNVTTHVLPFPNYIDGIDDIPVPITPQSVPDYWRKGKQMILEELPNFHQRPEWKDYRRRRYAHGAKKGAIQHAVFRDILAALRSIAGSNRRESIPSKKRPRLK